MVRYYKQNYNYIWKKEHKHCFLGQKNLQIHLSKQAIIFLLFIWCILSKLYEMDINLQKQIKYTHLYWDTYLHISTETDKVHICSQRFIRKVKN